MTRRRSRHRFNADDLWVSGCNDPDEWMAPFRDGPQEPELPEVRSLLSTLRNRRALLKLRGVRTSLRKERKHDNPPNPEAV